MIGCQLISFFLFSQWEVLWRTSGIKKGVHGIFVHKPQYMYETLMAQLHPMNDCEPLQPPWHWELTDQLTAAAAPRCVSQLINIKLWRRVGMQSELLCFFSLFQHWRTPASSWWTSPTTSCGCRCPTSRCRTRVDMFASSTRTPRRRPTPTSPS